MGNIIEKEQRYTEPVETMYGKLVGRKIISEGDRPVNAFQGVPFAKPPLRNLRFKKPEKPEPWKDVQKAVGFRARPIQKDESPLEALKLPRQSEDCLHLNVFTPAWKTDADTLFPVMVFIHGGGFVFDSVVKYGDIGISMYLVAQCETVVVTVEYRLGYLGFFTTAGVNCDDNAGLYDIIKALEWVRDNIRAFRGDPNNVTLWGQSAGGCAVDLISVSPESKGLFHRIILMSGNANAPWAITHNGVEKCRIFASSQEICTIDPVQMIEKLCALEANKFARGMADISVDLLESVIAPRIGGELLPRPISALREEAPHYKRIIGVCEYEGIMYASGNITLSMTETLIANLLPETDFLNFAELRKQALALYIQPNDYDNKTAVIAAWVKCMSDTFLNISVQQNVLDQHQIHTEDVYLYSFDYYNPNSLFPNLPMKGATHCIDLNYLLYINMFSKYKLNDTDMRVLRIMTKLWSNFAKYGDPNGSPDSRPEGDFEWLPATPQHPSRFLSIGPQPTMRDNFQDGRPMFWIELKKQRPQ